MPKRYQRGIRTLDCESGILPLSYRTPYYSCTDCTFRHVVKETVVIISEDLKHYWHAVQHFVNQTMLHERAVREAGHTNIKAREYHCTTDCQRRHHTGDYCESPRTTTGHPRSVLQASQPAYPGDFRRGEGVKTSRRKCWWLSMRRWASTRR